MGASPESIITGGGYGIRSIELHAEHRDPAERDQYANQKNEIVGGSIPDDRPHYCDRDADIFHGRLAGHVCGAPRHHRWLAHKFTAAVPVSPTPSNALQLCRTGLASLREAE